MLSDEFRRIVGVPDYYVDEYNATTMINFWPIVAAFADAFRPRSICEIGSERGLTSERLSALLPDVRIHVVDPRISDRVKSMPNVDAHEETSKDFLSRRKKIPFYLIDGDHNYETVSMEIREAVRNNGDGPFCAMFHDAGWPFARRDGYYAPSLVSNPRPHRHHVFLRLEDQSMQQGGRGFQNGESFALAETAGGPRNGVLTAIEDFVAGSPDQWALLRVPMFYGLAILWRPTGLSDSSLSKIASTVAAIELMSPVFSCAEANRLRLLQGLAEHRDDHARLSRRTRWLRAIPGIGRFFA
jgi:hypothetical protein